jgi:hypothetical protein
MMQGREENIKEKVKERYGKIALTGNSDWILKNDGGRMLISDWLLIEK